MTNYIQASMVNRAEASREVREFDAVDNKGRKLGYRVTITKTEYVADEKSVILVCPAKIGVSFSVQPHVMRGGHDFGAIPVNAVKICKTYPEALAAAELMFAKAAKAAAKKAGA